MAKEYLIKLLTDDSEECKEVEEALKEELESGTIERVPINSEEGKRLKEMARVGSDEVPVPLAVTDDFKEIVKCALKAEGEDLIIECDVEKEKSEREEKDDNLEMLKKKVGIACMSNYLKSEIAWKAGDSLSPVEKLLLQKIPECEGGKLVGFSPVKGGKGKKSEYQKFIAECIKASKLPVREAMKECAKKWKEKGPT